MARVKAALVPSALRGLDPRHALPSLGIYRSVGGGGARWSARTLLDTIYVFHSMTRLTLRFNHMQEV